MSDTCKCSRYLAVVLKNVRSQLFWGQVDQIGRAMRISEIEIAFIFKHARGGNGPCPFARFAVVPPVYTGPKVLVLDRQSL